MNTETVPFGTWDREPGTAPASSTPGGVDQAVRDLADAIGEDPARIRVRDPRWATYLKEGCVVRLHVGRWRAVTTLTQADLGLTPHDEDERRAWDRVLLLGRRLLLPRDIVDRAERLESQARRLLEAHALRTCWGLFVHKDRYRAWSPQNEALRSVYLALGQEIAADWAALQRQVREDYRTLGRQNYRRLRALGIASLPAETAWVETFVERALAGVPTPEYVAGSFTYTWEAEYLPLASQLAEEEARAEAVRAGAALARRELAAREEALSAMERDLLATARRRKEQDLDRFVADVQTDLRARIYEVCCDVLASVRRRGGALPGNSVKQLRNLVEAVGRLKFWDDADLDREMATIRGLLAAGPRQRSPAAITNLVERLGAESRIALLELDRAPRRSGRDAGVPDELPALRAVVRRARSTPADLFDAIRVGEAEVARSGRRARVGPAGAG
jgi:hypothetical protein